MQTAQELIDEIDEEQKELAIIKKIGDGTLKKWGEMGIDFYVDDQLNKTEDKK